jgi:hypothetical protein
LLRSVVIQTTELLKDTHQTFVVEHSVMKPHWLKVFARQGCQYWFVGHVNFFLLHTSRNATTVSTKAGNALPRGDSRGDPP